MDVLVLVLVLVLSDGEAAVRRWVISSDSAWTRRKRAGSRSATSGLRHSSDWPVVAAFAAKPVRMAAVYEEEEEEVVSRSQRCLRIYVPINKMKILISLP